MCGGECELTIGIVPAVLPAGGTLGRLVGRPFPTKVGAAGRQQPYDAGGRYLPFDANPGTLYGAAAQAFGGIGQGYGEVLTGIQAPPPLTGTQRTAQTLGRILGHLANFIR
jgi:hypothetical protein